MHCPPLILYVVVIGPRWWSGVRQTVRPMTSSLRPKTIANSSVTSGDASLVFRETDIPSIPPPWFGRRGGGVDVVKLSHPRVCQILCKHKRQTGWPCISDTKFALNDTSTWQSTWQRPRQPTSVCLSCTVDSCMYYSEYLIKHRFRHL